MNNQLFGELIDTQSSSVFMLGPNALTLIRGGARFTPCMKSPTSLTDKPIQCPATMRPEDADACTVNDVCGIPVGVVPDQWYVFLLRAKCECMDDYRLTSTVAPRV